MAEVPTRVPSFPSFPKLHGTGSPASGQPPGWLSRSPLLFPKSRDRLNWVLCPTWALRTRSWYRSCDDLGSRDCWDSRQWRLMSRQWQGDRPPLPRGIQPTESKRGSCWETSNAYLCLIETTLRNLRKRWRPGQCRSADECFPRLGSGLPKSSIQSAFVPRHTLAGMHSPGLYNACSPLLQTVATTTKWRRMVGRKLALWYNLLAEWKGKCMSFWGQTLWWPLAIWLRRAFRMPARTTP